MLCCLFRPKLDCTGLICSKPKPGWRIITNRGDGPTPFQVPQCSAAHMFRGVPACSIQGVSLFRTKVQVASFLLLTKSHTPFFLFSTCTHIMLGLPVKFDQFRKEPQVKPALDLCLFLFSPCTSEVMPLWFGPSSRTWEQVTRSLSLAQGVTLICLRLYRDYGAICGSGVRLLGGVLVQGSNHGIMFVSTSPSPYLS